MLSPVYKCIVYRLNPYNLADLINEREETVRDAMAKGLNGYIPNVDADTVGDGISLVLAENIQLAAGLVPQDKLTKQREQNAKAELKSKYEDFLLTETGNYCPFPGCGRELVIFGNGKAIPTYEVNLIEKDKPATSDNLIALCPQCSTTYSLDNEKKTMTALKKVKKTKEEIFEEIVDKIHRMTLQEMIYCQIVVCFFIQKCEVYDAITE